MANSENDSIQYSLGYQDGFLDAKKQFERPQGEWICHTDGYTAFYTCNKCNNFGHTQDKFCPSCGAEMKKEESSC